MPNTPWFFVTLGLLPTDDQQAIRRAYAQCLKGLDQQHQAEQFQQLRLAYKLAQQWQAEQPAVTQAVVLSTEPVQYLEAEQSALEGWLEQLCQPQLENAELLLKASLADLRLSLAEREQLQQHLLAFLRQSNQANLPLFEAAACAWDWRKNLPFLQSEEGAWVESYLQEEDGWLAQDEVVKTQQLLAIELLGSREPPSLYLIKRHWPELIAVQHQYPRWLNLRLGSQRVHDCQQRYTRSDSQVRNNLQPLIWLLLLLLVSCLFLYLGRNTYSDAPFEEFAPSGPNLHKATTSKARYCLFPVLC